MVSGAGVENPPRGDDVFEVYLRAKAEADAAVQASDLEWTILRPGGLTDDPGTGNVRIDVIPFSDPVHVTMSLPSSPPCSRTEEVSARFST